MLIKVLQKHHKYNDSLFQWVWGLEYDREKRERHGGGEREGEREKTSTSQIYK